jgi:hypothetical protein
MASEDPSRAVPAGTGARLHLRVGWWALALFVLGGLTLESLIGLRVPWYVDAANETRRMMFRLAHAHGTLLALINVAFGLALQSGARTRPLPRWASPTLLAATALVPLGFGGGGVIIHDGDPGLPILLVPAGALALVASLAGIAGTFSPRSR